MTRTRSLVLLGVLVLAAPVPLAAQVAPLALVVESLDAAPGSEVALIVRTLRAEPLASGELTLVVEPKDPDDPPKALAALVSATAYSGAGDAVVDATFDHEAQRVAITFASPSSTLNSAFGPLLVLRFQLEALADRDRFDVRIDRALVHLQGPGGEEVPTCAGRGRLRIRIPDGTLGLGAMGEEFFPGDLLVFGAVSSGPLAIGSATVELLYDTAVVVGPPVVTIDPRYGDAVVDVVKELEPGRLLVELHSPPGDLNAALHGLFLTVAVPSDPAAPPGTLMALALGPATALFDPAGNPIPIETDGDVIEILPPGLLLRAGFELGDVFEFGG